MKAHWYSLWIKKSVLRSSTSRQTRELDVIHAFLESVCSHFASGYMLLSSPQFESPLWAGKLPIRMGEPAGGSLSADEYKFAATTALPIIVRHKQEIYLLLSLTYETDTFCLGYFS